MLNDLTPHRQALTEQGYTIVSVDGCELVAVRLRICLDLCMRMTTIIRIRQLGSLTHESVTDAESTMGTLGARLDPSILPRGFQQGRVLIDCMMAEHADEAVLAWARRTVGKGMGMSYHPIVISPQGSAFAPAPMWGRIFWPRVKHDLDLLIEPTAVSTRPPLSPLGLVLTFLIYGPLMVLLTLSCCGMPVLLLLLFNVMEKKKLRALQDT